MSETNTDQPGRRPHPESERILTEWGARVPGTIVPPDGGAEAAADLYRDGEIIVYASGRQVQPAEAASWRTWPVLVALTHGVALREGAERQRQLDDHGPAPAPMVSVR